MVSAAVMLSNHCVGQDSPGKATVSSTIGSDGQGAIIVEAHGHLPEPPVFFATDAKADVRVDSKTVTQAVAVKIKVLQGKAKTLSLGLRGDGQVTGVAGESLASWAIRQVSDQRFLDLQVEDDTTELNCTVTIKSAEFSLPKKGGAHSSNAR